MLLHGHRLDYFESLPLADRLFCCAAMQVYEEQHAKEQKALISALIGRWIK